MDGITQSISGLLSLAPFTERMGVKVHPGEAGSVLDPFASVSASCASQLDDVPLQESTKFRLFVLQLVGIWVVSTLGLS